MLALVLGAATPLTADADDKTRADEQFEFGLSEMQAGRFDIGCPALAESYRLDPAAGALFTLAACEAQWGRIASAVEHYEQYLALFEQMTPETQGKQKGREKTAASQIELLTPKVPKLTITLSDKSPPGSTVKLDGQPIDSAKFGSPVRIDPGEHVVSATADGVAAEQHRITVAQSEHARLYLDLSPGGTSEVLEDGGDTTPAPPPDEPSSGGVPTAAYVAGGIGIVGIAVGAVTGFVALGKKSTIDDNCPDRQCNAEGREAVDSGQSMATISTIGFGIGVVGLATGVVLWLVAPSGESSNVGSSRPLRVGSAHVPGGEMLTVEASW